MRKSPMGSLPSYVRTVKFQTRYNRENGEEPVPFLECSEANGKGELNVRKYLYQIRDV